MSKYEVYVKGITGDTKIIQLSNDNPITVYDFKKLIDEDEHYMIILLHNGVELNNEQFLSAEYNTILYLVKLNIEVETLLEIKRKMNIEDAELNWSKDIDLSEWDRIAIYSDNDLKYRVGCLDLSYLRLEGKIPKEIGKLVNLQTLNLSGNQLTGEIPKEIGKLVGLWELRLNNNQLTGKIPKDIGKLINLQELYLDNNQLTGEIPKEIGELASLDFLQLFDNKLTGKIPCGPTDLECFEYDEDKLTQKEHN